MKENSFVTFHLRDIRSIIADQCLDLSPNQTLNTCEHLYEPLDHLQLEGNDKN